MNFQQFLESKRACEAAQEWAQDKTIQEAIDQCHRGDWLLWLTERLGVDERLIIGAEGHCANTVRHLMQDERSRNCVDVKIKYGKNEVTKQELVSAWVAAKAAARAAYRAFDAVAAADEAAARAADADADAAAAWAARAADAAEAFSKNQHQTADICREHLKEAIIKKWNQIQTS